MAACRFQHTINGRKYTIEAIMVRDNRWRAQIVRLPGMRSSLMPFYGTTADDAAERLKGVALARSPRPGDAGVRGEEPGIRNEERGVGDQGATAQG